MTENSNAGKSKLCGLRQFGLMALILLGLLFFLFRDAFRHDMTVFSNDGPLGQISSAAADTWASRDGAWLDLNWLGSAGIAAVPSFSNLLGITFGKLWFSKLYALYSLLFVGFGAWYCFRQWKFTPATCIIGGIAAALNGDFLPTTCWGVCAQPICFGLNYFALGFLADTTSPRRWLRVAVAGFAVGMGVMEAFDIGGIFSLFVAAFAIFQTFAGEGSNAQKIVRSVTRLGVVAICALLIAIGAVSTLFKTQISGVAGMAQDADTKAAKWDEATIWSFPKRETLSVAFPGIFGLRMSPPPEDGSNYWGAIGRHPSWDRWFASQDPNHPPGGFIRYGGGSGYAGALVIVLAIWALLQSFRKKSTVFTTYQKRMIWFWLGVVVVGALLAYGRYAPFYQFFYALPGASMIRNPAKFVHVLEWGLLILFGYGLDGLCRTYLQPAANITGDWMAQWKNWRAKGSGFERAWFKGSLIALAAILVGWFLYGASTGKLIAYLQKVQFPVSYAQKIASYSVAHVGWSFVLYAIALGLVMLVIAGCFNGSRARAGTIALGIFLTLDLALYSGIWTGSKSHWIVTYNWKERLDSNPLVDYLSKGAYERRVTVFPLDQFVNLNALPQQMQPLANQYQNLKGLYSNEWLQHLFPRHNIQNTDVVQEPRMGSDKMAYIVGVGSAGQLRMWQLTGTSHFLAPAAVFSLLNQQLDPQLQRFRIAARFDLAPKPGVVSATSGDEITTVLNTNGQYAVIEFTGAVPRAKLYSNWQVASTNATDTDAWLKKFEKWPPEFVSALHSLPPAELATVRRLADPAFDPAQTVLVGGDNAPAPNISTNQDAGTVTYESYSPKRIMLSAKAKTPAVLLLNDRYNADWKVTVDGKPTPLFRANYIARGVALPAGDHKVEFYFSVPTTAANTSAAFIVVAVLLMVYLGLVPTRQLTLAEAPATTPKSDKPDKK